MQVQGSTATAGSTDSSPVAPTAKSVAKQTPHERLTSLGLKFIR
jgi:hypothetical protein